MPSLSIGSASASKPLAEWYGEMEQAERGDGWAWWCAQHGIFVVPCRELIDAVAEILSPLPDPQIEIASGKGHLAEALDIQATDPAPGAAHVLQMDARSAIDSFHPRTVLCCFPPVDAGIEHAIAQSQVDHFLYIGPEPPRFPDWQRQPLPDVDTALLTRLDHLVDYTRATHRRGASAILFTRYAHKA